MENEIQFRRRHASGAGGGAHHNREFEAAVRFDRRQSLRARECGVSEAATSPAVRGRVHQRVLVAGLDVDVHGSYALVGTVAELSYEDRRRFPQEGISPRVSKLEDG